MAISADDAEVGDPVLGTFDTETTGVDVETVRIVSAHIGLLDRDGNVIASHDWLINPGVEIPQGAINVHGITNERAQAEGVAPLAALPEIDALLAQYLRFGLPLVIYNAPYDLTLLDREMRRHTGEGLSFDPRPILDPMVIDKSINKYGKGGRKLVNVAERWGVTVKDAHEAAADALMAGRIALAMLAHPRISRFTLDALHDHTITRKREQMEGYADWCRTSGKDTSGIKFDWPIFPVPTESSLS